jgi:REP element-mobilizing transposase RayT
MCIQGGVKMTQSPHSSSLRQGRYSQAGFIYLVTVVTAQRRPVFLDFTAARQLVKIFQDQSQASRAQTLAYVVMPDHFHWLMQLGEIDSLSSCVQRVKSAGTKAMGPHLWQKGFHDRAVRSEDDLRALARYVVSNPVRAGLTHRVGAYSHWDAVWV